MSQKETVSRRRAVGDDKKVAHRPARSMAAVLVFALVVLGVLSACAVEAVDGAPNGSGEPPTRRSASPIPAQAGGGAAPAKLIFVHHSTGESWLADGHGRLAVALRDNGYFVSDTNYGWGPDGIGSTTDLGHWWSWFCGPSSSKYMNALYAENGQHSNGYSRLATDPGGRNEIVMFKSCFPNSVLRDDGAPVPAIADNPLKGMAWGGGPGWEVYTVANVKGIYLDLLKYFGAHPDKFFVAVVASPVVDEDTPDGRKLANWLVDHWLQDAGYNVGNVMVFDLYNVLTSKTGGGASDVDLATGNHHRIWKGAVQHKTDDGADRLAYPTAADDSHPNAAGLKKATSEFVPLLNAAYSAWKDNKPAADTIGPRTFAPRSASVKKGRRATLYYRVTDNASAQAAVTIHIRNSDGAVKKKLALGLKGTGALRHRSFVCRLPKGVYRFEVFARDLSGNAAEKPLGRNRLTVR